MNFTKTLTELVNKVLTKRTEVLYKRIAVNYVETNHRYMVTDYRNKTYITFLPELKDADLTEVPF